MDEPAAPAVSILLLTERRQRRSAGPTVLVKPVSRPELVARVRAILRQRALNGGHEVSVGHPIQLEDGEAWCHGRARV